MNLISTIFGRTAKLSMEKQVGPASEDDIKQGLASIDAITATMAETDNWKVIFHRMRSYIVDHPNSYGMSMARDSWQSMQGGYGSWSDYYIPHDDFETRKRLNEELQSYCTAWGSALSAYADE
ncbi:MAG: hypothetical protein MKZ70_04140 [Opitutales bacterium]|nr:hypothetical protein [Opitutales bacterium]